MLSDTIQSVVIDYIKKKLSFSNVNTILKIKLNKLNRCEKINFYKQVIQI